MNDTYARRRKRLLEKSNGVPFVVLDLDRIMPPDTDQIGLRYLSGYSGEGVLLIAEETTVLFTDSRYLEQADREVPGLRRVHAENDYFDDIAPVLRELGINTLSYSSWRTTDFVVRTLEARTGVSMVAVQDPIGELRAVKDAAEVECISRATEIAEEALGRLLPSIRVGMNEVEIADRLVDLMDELGSERAAFGPTVASGPNSALPHYRPAMSRRVLAAGDLLLFDFGAVVGGYASDVSRTFVLGSPTEQQDAMYRLVNEALEAGLALLRAGAKGCDVHGAASSVIKASSFAEYMFLSPLGHGVGLQVHETPRMGARMENVLESGMVVTVEPGIYIPGVGGVRIEEMARIADDGYELLSRSPRDQLQQLNV